MNMMKNVFNGFDDEFYRTSVTAELHIELWELFPSTLHEFDMVLEDTINLQYQYE